ncbi:MAG: iron-sulfur protein [Acidimicrobiales bacterium]|nr:iron-sulfur protein [Acidimicrobiales bacterium]
MKLYDLVQRLEHAENLDPIARPASKAVARAVPHGPLKDLLSGTWLGHPLHPMLTDVPIGAWVSATVLDLVGGEGAQDAADALVGLGVLAAAPTVASGLSDWSDFLGGERRVGFVHAVANGVALACYASSLVARRRGSRTLGVALSGLGAAAMSAGGYLGGHLSYAQGANVNRNAWDEGIGEWTPVADESELGGDGPHMVDVQGTAVLVHRRGGELTAIADHCGHAGGPLHEGEFDDGCVRCPWHGSTFRLGDGDVVHGPATMPQPAYEVRVEDGKVLLRSAPPV